MIIEKIGTDTYTLSFLPDEVDVIDFKFYKSGSGYPYDATYQTELEMSVPMAGDRSDISPIWMFCSCLETARNLMQYLMNVDDKRTLITVKADCQPKWGGRPWYNINEITRIAGVVTCS